MHFARPTCVVLLTVLGSAAVVSAQSIAPAAFVANNAGGTITSFTLNPDGTLNNVGNFTTGAGPQTLALSPDGAILAVSHGTASETVEELRFFGVNADATLTPLLTTTTPDSPLDSLWLDNNILAVTVTRLSGSSQVRSLIFDRATNAITGDDTANTGTFTSTIGAAADRLFASSGFLSNGAISTWSFDSDGQFTFSDNDAVPGGGIAVDFQVASGGDFLYAAGGVGGNGNELHGFRLDPDGTIDPLPGSPFILDETSPAELALGEDGNTLYVGFNGAAVGQGIIRALSIDPDTGVVTDTGNVISVGDRGDTGPMGVIGNILFNLDGSTSSDGVRGLETILIDSDGSLSSIGVFDTGSAVGFAPDLAVWQGIPEPGTGLVAGLTALALLRRRR